MNVGYANTIMNCTKEQGGTSQQRFKGHNSLRKAAKAFNSELTDSSHSTPWSLATAFFGVTTVGKGAVESLEGAYNQNAVVRNHNSLSVPSALTRRWP